MNIATKHRWKIRPRRIFTRDNDDPIGGYKGRADRDRTHAALSHLKLQNPSYSNENGNGSGNEKEYEKETIDEKNIDISLQDNDDEAEHKLWSKPLSKFSWAKRHLPLVHLNKIINQLKEGNEFILTYNEWLTADAGDIELFVGYYEEKYHSVCRIKITNNDRRRLLRLWQPISKQD